MDVLADGRSEQAQLRERLQAALAAQARSILRSPASGVVLTRAVEPGDLVQPGRVLLEIALQGDTEIVVPVDEKNLSTLALGQSAQCLTDAWPQRPFAAQLTFIAPSIDAQRGVVELRLKVDPVPDYLRQDMTVSVNILTAQRTQALAVPNDALLAVQGTTAAVLRVREGRVTHVPVQLGLRGLALTEVVAGLAPGDRVLAGAEGQQQADGKRVRVALQLLPDPADSTAGQRSELPVRFN
jgi:HlyD family secretion protein